MSNTILKLPPTLVIVKIVGDADPIMVIVQFVATTAVCPSCGRPSAQVHSDYTRTLLHCPWSTVPVTLQIGVHRWVCAVPGCTQTIFCERLSGLAEVKARRTKAFTRQVESMAFHTSAEGTARAARAQGLPISADTVLRIIKDAEDPPCEQPRAVGIDDWAWRKGKTYGTIVID